jgi:hypothetical protein
MSMPDARDVRDQSRTLAAVGLWTDTDLSLAGGTRRSGSKPRSEAPTCSRRWACGRSSAAGSRARSAGWRELRPVVLGARVWRERFASDPT